jgi:hypothetical protein
MSTSSVAGFTLPDCFDVASYDLVNERVASIANPNDAGAPWKKNAWFGYASAWNGLAVRLRSAVEYNQEFGRMISLGAAPPPEDRYTQERALFGCIAAALSAIECFYMASYCVATVLAPLHFQLQNAKDLNQNPIDIADAYLSWLPTDPFSLHLAKVAKSKELYALAEIRNTLAHRGVLPRAHYLSTDVGAMPSSVPDNPKALAADFAYTASWNEATTAIHTRWMCQTSSQLVAAFKCFLEVALSD